jgi:hypothetical protein
MYMQFDEIPPLNVPINQGLPTNSSSFHGNMYQYVTGTSVAVQPVGFGSYTSEQAGFVYPSTSTFLLEGPNNFASPATLPNISIPTVQTGPSCYITNSSDLSQVSF